MKLFNKQFIKYLFIGIQNTLIGFSIIFILMYYKVIPEIANIIGYSIGIIYSYLMNKTFTFKTKSNFKKEFIKFIFTMGIAYLINIIILILLIRILNINEYISQVIAGIFYTISGYLFSKKFVFNK